MKIALSLCDYTGNMVRPWAAAGFQCYCIDIAHPPGKTFLHQGVWAISKDVRRVNRNPEIKPSIVFAFPPCTDLAVSGARYFVGKGLKALASAIGIVAECLDICELMECPWMIENPVSTISTYWRKPNFTFDPCDYAGYLASPDEDAYTKKTCIWSGGGFVKPEPKRVEPIHGSKMHVLPPSDDRARIRSETPMGFAWAVFDANIERIGRP